MRNGLIFGAAIALVASFTPISALASNSAIAAVNKSGSGKAAAEASIIIKAPARLVWNAVHAERNQNPEVEYSKVIEDSGNVKVLEQKFTNIPVLGAVTAVTRHVEEPLKRIDYSLVRSDKFKALEGSWVLTPLNGGKETKLSLRSHLDIGVPFSGIFIKSATLKKLNKRVANVKQIAEREQARLAALGERE